MFYFGIKIFIKKNKTIDIKIILYNNSYINKYLIIYMEISEVLKLIREYKRITLEEVAVKMKISRERVSKIEKSAGIKTSTLLRYLEAIEISLSSFSLVYDIMNENVYMETFSKEVEKSVYIIEFCINNENKRNEKQIRYNQTRYNICS